MLGRVGLLNRCALSPLTEMIVPCILFQTQHHSQGSVEPYETPGVVVRERNSTVKKPKQDAFTPFRDKLLELFEKQVKGMDGADVVLGLKQAGEEIWTVGIDKTYTAMKHQDDEALGNAFDITWLT